MANQPEICRFYLQGKCTYGNKCRFAHPPNRGGRGGGNTTRFDNGRNWDRMGGGNSYSEADYGLSSTNWRGGGRERGGGNNWIGQTDNNWRGGRGNNWRGGNRGNNWRGGGGGGNNWSNGRGSNDWSGQGSNNWRGGGGGGNNWRGGRGSNDWIGQGGNDWRGGGGNNWRGRGNNWRGGSNWGENNWSSGRGGNSWSTQGGNNWRGGGRGGWQGGSGRGNFLSDISSSNWKMDDDSNDMSIDDDNPPTADKIVLIIKEDMLACERGHLWPFSFYTPFHMCPSLPDLQDHSMEEIRYLAYQSINNSQHYLDTYKKLYEQQKLLWNRYQSITPDEITQFIKSRQTSTSQSTYDRTPAISRNPFHTMTHTPVKDLFGVKEMKHNQSSSPATTASSHKLTQTELDSYNAPQFTPGKIPETPPTDNLCN